MPGNFRFYANIVSTILVIILVFMIFLGYWGGAKFAEILFFFGMIFAVFGVGVEIGKKLKK